MALCLGLLLTTIALAQTPPWSSQSIAVPPSGASTDAAQLPVAMGNVIAADIVVKAVMIGLVLASVLTWTIWFAKAFPIVDCQAPVTQSN